MFERFTDRARRVVVKAQDEARRLDHNYIGTEHLLLGLTDEREGVGAKALDSLGISLDVVRQQLEEIIGRGKKASSGHIPFTPRAKKALELSLRESILLGHTYIGTEHILLGLISEDEGVAAQVLVRLGADQNRVRLHVIELLAGRQGGQPQGRAARARRVSPRSFFSREEEIIRMLADISTRLRAVEEHLGIRQSTEAGDDALAAAAEPGEPGAAEGPAQTGSGAAGPDDQPGQAQD